MERGTEQEKFSRIEMPDKNCKSSLAQNIPKWRVIKPIPPLMIPNRIMQESNQANRSKPIIKVPKYLSENSDKDSYKLLLLIRELALSQEREEILNDCISRDKEAHKKVELDLSRSRQQLDDLHKKQQSLHHQLRESSKIISHYEQEISVLRNKPCIAKSSIGVGTADSIISEISKVNNPNSKSNTKQVNPADLEYFLKLCRQNEMSISYMVEPSEKLDTASSISESSSSFADQKIQILNDCHLETIVIETNQSKSFKKIDMGIQTENQTDSSKENISKEIQVDPTPEDLRFIMNAYAENRSVTSKKEPIHENTVSFKDRIRIFSKNPCFKTSPKNSICTCVKKSEISKSSTESSQSNNDLYLLQDETSMLLPLPDLLAELESSFKSIEIMQVEQDKIIVQEDICEKNDDLSNLIQILNF